MKTGKMIPLKAAILFALVSFALHLATGIADASEVVFMAGDTRIVIEKDGTMKCSYCGYGDRFVSIKGPVPEFTGKGSGPQAFFGDRFLLIVRTDMGTSCAAGAWYVIDLRKRTSSELKLPNCQEVTPSFLYKDGKVEVNLTQGAKKTRFLF